MSKNLFFLFLIILSFLFSSCGGRNFWTNVPDDEYHWAMSWKVRAGETTGYEQQKAQEKYYSLLKTSINDYNELIRNPLFPVKDSTIYATTFCWSCTEMSKITNDYDAAIKCHEKRLELFPNNLHSYGHLINLYNKTKEYTKAITVAEKMLDKISIQIQEEKYDRSFPIGWLIYLNNCNENYLVSLKYAESLEKMKPDKYDYYNIGEAHGKLGDVNKKIFYWKKAAALGNDDAIQWLKEQGDEQSINTQTIQPSSSLSKEDKNATEKIIPENIPNEIKKEVVVEKPVIEIPGIPNETKKEVVVIKPGLVTEAPIQKWVLSEINFGFDDSKFTPESYPLLVNVVDTLLKNPNLKVEIRSYTDNIGAAVYNKILSQKRADIVKNYLITKSIAADRLISIGYGESNSLADNKNPEGRAMNNRIEFVLKSDIGAIK